MSTPTIPRGWRRLRKGTAVRNDDKCHVLLYVDTNTNRAVYGWAPCLWNYAPVDSDETIIRRVAKKKGRK